MFYFFIFIFMEASKVLALMAEIMSDDVQKFNYSPQDVIDIYCQVRNCEENLKQRQKKMCAAPVIPLKLSALAAMKLHLCNIYEFITKDEAGAAKMERWYHKSKQGVSLENKTKVLTPKKPAAKKKIQSSSKGVSSLWLGVQKSQPLIETCKLLTDEKVWKGEMHQSQVSESAMKKFFFTLCKDEYWFGQLQKNVYVAIDCEQRVKALVQSRLHLQNYFKFNYHKEAEVEFEDWYQSVLSVLKPDIDLLEKVIANARTETELLSAQADFSNFWGRLQPFCGQACWLNLTTQIRAPKGVEPEHKMFVLDSLALLEKHYNVAQNELLSEIKHSKQEIIGLEAKHFLLLRKELKKITQVKRIVVFTKDCSERGAFVWTCE